MIIRYSKRHAVEAALLSRSNESMRVQIRGLKDVTELRQVGGTWLTEDGEPVQIQFEWERRVRPPVVTVDDCICSDELAGRLLEMLFAGESDPETLAAARLELN